MSTEHPLRAWRDTEKVSQSELAKQVSVAPSHISMIENRQKNASLPLALKLSKITAIPVEEFSRDGAAA
jgi:DNA-binding XRE family transcriptional regulator